MSYSGSERRIHKVYITRNTEYHVREGICVAVRDRNGGGFHTAHMALSLRMDGAVRIYSNGGIIPQANAPEPGDAIYFTYKRPDGEERQIVTSKLISVERPAKKVVQAYPPMHPATARKAARQSFPGSW
ncbi:MAG: hypothetical protein IPK82_33915 [Polyangiaceae bacterium]|nr:hypothetical protein [Polyangiaceae bacterium]